MSGLSLNGYILLLLCQRLCILLGNGQSQDAVFEFTLYILVSHVPAHIEASLTGAGITPVSYTHLDVYKRQVLLTPKTS